jgi:hypothetical protein
MRILPNLSNYRYIDMAYILDEQLDLSGVSENDGLKRDL